MEVYLFSDGAARGNPGPGGYGTLLRYTSPDGHIYERELSKGYRCTTNNRMELLAVIVGLEALNRPCNVVVCSDSQYLVNAFNKHWVEGWIKRGWKTAHKDPIKNIDLWRRLLAAKEPHRVRFEWVRGHAGHPENEQCDKLATTAADSDVLAIDEYYENTIESKMKGL